MPDIDLTDLLMDPEIAGEPFIVIRRQVTIDQHGRNVIASKRMNAVGSLTPTSDNSLVREAAFATQAKTMMVITTFALRGPSKDRAANGQELQFMPDVVIWRGDSYEPVVISDYSRYGAGFIQADCMSVDYVDQASEMPPA